MVKLDNTKGVKMSNFIILTESASDVPASVRKELGIEVYKVPVMIDEEPYEYNVEIDDGFVDFYAKLKAGSVVKTAAVSPFGYREIIESYFKQGKDILYVAYSGAISNALEYYKQAASELMQEYPERKALLADTLSLAYGSGMLVVEAAKMLKEGKSAEEIIAYVDEAKFKTAVCFTPETLTYLKRGGRLSGAAAMIGNMLNLKPILAIGDNGKLESQYKVSGRKKSLLALLNEVERLGENLNDREFCVVHAACENDANFLAEQAKVKFNLKSVNIYSVGPVIGAHCGPGTIGIAFNAKKRV